MLAPPPPRTFIHSYKFGRLFCSYKEYILTAVIFWELGNFWSSFVPYFIGLFGLELGRRFSLYSAWGNLEEFGQLEGDEPVLPFGRVREDIPGGFGIGIVSLFLKKVRKAYLGVN
jgi:hypothetical protein